MTRSASSLRTITVADLIDLLQDQDPDARVILTADYGVESAYSSSGFAIAESDDGLYPSRNGCASYVRGTR